MSGGGGGGGAGGAGGLMSCVREGSIEPPYSPPAPAPAPVHDRDTNHGEGRTGRFLRGLRRMFKRRGSGTRADASPDPKSSSTSELLDADSHARRKEGAYSSGLSVSHDSVFTGERSGDESGEERPAPAHHLAQIATSHRAELVAAVRRRGRGDVSDDEDLGLPSSPPASPPTYKVDKRHHAGISQSSCSDGSLLSVGSSEMDEDSSSGHHNSQDHSSRSDHSDIYASSEPPTGVAPLSHSAARHKMAVRPRRTHGAPRRKKNNAITASALPITPELNEEMIRSATPEVIHKTSEVVTESFSSSRTTKHHVIVKEKHHLVNRELQKVLDTPSDTKMKSSSLPPGLALNQLIGQSPAKLSVAESTTPRSSIKRSQSSTQSQPIKDESPKPQVKSETRISHSDTRTKHRMEKYAEESCLEKKSKSEKKLENDAIKCSKKEESFFSRWLLRKSGKKAKKDQVDGDTQHEVKKSKNEKAGALYKIVDSDKSTQVEQVHGNKPVPAERTHKTAGQKVFANQMHKRLDNKGAYVQEGVYKEPSSSAKITSDLRSADDTDRLLNLEIKNRCSRQEDLTERVDRIKRTSYKEAVDDNNRESLSFYDKSKKPTPAQKHDMISTKAFISNEIANISKEESRVLRPLGDEPPTKAVRIKKPYNDIMFHSGSMPKNIPYFNPNVTVPDSPSPPKTIFHQSSGNVRQKRSSEFPEFREKIAFDTRREKSYHVSKTEEFYTTSGVRSLGDEFVEARSSIGKSHSFRYASESTSISSQENQLPSLPAIVGISEPLLDNWEVNYRKNSLKQDYSKRVSARNYNVTHGPADANFDSLPSTDSSFMDSLKNEQTDVKSFPNTIHITIENKRDSDISQIEAKIDDIIKSPKPIMAPMLKSNSLDSVKSSPEKIVDDRRKTISVESALSQNAKINSKEIKQETESFISVTHINTDDPKPTPKTEEKTQKISASKPGVPEFLFLQLNKVDPKPTTNVVLTANITPKKIDSPQADREQEIFEVTETKSTHIIQIGKDTVTNKIVEKVIDTSLMDDNLSPVFNRRHVVPPAAPQSPSASRAFFKKKSSSVDVQDKYEKTRSSSISTEGSIEKIHDNISIDQKSYSSFGSKSSIQSIDSNEIKAPDRNEETVIYRKRLSRENRGDKKNDDEPELMKVFARRSLKIKDSDADHIAKDIAETNAKKDEDAKKDVAATRTKILKNEFNASIKSRDSDKENEDTVFKEDDNRASAVATRVSQFGNYVVPHYQRSVSITSVNPKRESAPIFRNEVSKYKKEVSDSTPEKRLRNRTFPDLSNDREEIKNISRNDGLYKDSLPKKSWQRNDDRLRYSMDRERRESATIDKDEREKGEENKEKDGEEESLQFKCIFERRAEWEKRAQQGMTK